MEKECKKCGHIRKANDLGPDYECPSCGAIYEKVEAALASNQNISDKAPSFRNRGKPRGQKFKKTIYINNITTITNESCQR